MQLINANMKYRCIRAAKGLTPGKEYSELNQFPCVYNASIRNDFGNVIFMPRNTFFVKIDDS